MGNKTKKTSGELNRMDPHQRARYLAYQEAPKKVKWNVQAANKRLREAAQKNQKDEVDVKEEEEKKVYNILIGQLKAAEARDRIRLMRLQYQAMRSHEIKHLISCQPTSLKAIRFEALVPSKLDNFNPGDQLDKLQRGRVESILDDDQGLTTTRRF